MTLRNKHIVAAATFFLAVSQLAIADSAKHLSASESIATAVTKPQPSYPEMARQLRLEGAVTLNCYVTEDGAVEKVEPVSGNPILSRSAADALMRWKFSKLVEDGKPIKFVATITFNFKP